MSLLIVASVLLVVFLFYLVNAKDQSVKDLAWKTLSDATSLFIAICLFYSLHDLLNAELFRGSRKSYKVGFGFVLLLVFYSAIQVILAACRNRAFQLAGWGLIGAHIVGFVGVDTFGALQESSFFAESIGKSCLVVPIAATLFACASVSMHCLRAAFIKTKSEQILKKDSITATKTETTADDLDSWDHQCCHTEDEITSFALGVLLSQIIRYSILGYLPEIYGTKSKKDSKEVLLLFLVTVGLAAGVFITALLNGLVQSKGVSHHMMRLLGLINSVCAMTMAWCALFVSMWMWDLKGKGLVRFGETLTLKVWVAFTVTALSLCIVVVLTQAANLIQLVNRSGLDSFNGALVFLIGLSWEKAFMKAIDGMLTDSDQRPIFKASFRVALCLFIIPAWIWHILPKAVHEHHGHGHGHGHDDHDHGDHRDHCDHGAHSSHNRHGSHGDQGSHHDIYSDHGSFTGHGDHIDHGSGPPSKEGSIGDNNSNADASEHGLRRSVSAAHQGVRKSRMSSGGSELRLSRLGSAPRRSSADSIVNRVLCLQTPSEEQGVKT